MISIQQRDRSQHGFTLIEILIVMGLLSIFMVVLATLFTASVDVQNRSRNYSSVTTDGRFLLARLDYDITRASAISMPAALGGTSSSLVMTINSVSYTYSVANGRLRLTDGTGSDYLTSDDNTISGLSFTKIGNAGGLETIQYSFTLTGSAVSSVHSQTYTSTAERRS